MKINLITLGCSKNLVDSGKLLHQLKVNGHEISHNSQEYSHGLIINTCGFILDAKTESIETILEYAKAKKEGLIEKIAVMGCLSERYQQSLQKEIPEVDAFFGVNDIASIVGFFNGRYYADQLTRRIGTTPPHYAYLKISEGCNRSCAFCAIPAIRGKQISQPVEQLVEEAQNLADQGAKELILIAQELTSYGTDIYRKKALPDLIRELVKIQGFEWIRLHYAYPEGYPAEEIISLMKAHPKICRYLDIPVQHACNRVLKAMKRGHSREDFESIIQTFRQEIPGISVRSTIITGFPGETRKDFDILKEFISTIRFDRLGVFTYSHEEGTSAFELQDNIPEKEKIARMEEIMSIQQKISLEKNLEKIGETFRVLIDSKDNAYYIARTEADSPEVDNEVLIPSDNHTLKVGSFAWVRIVDATEFDLYAEPVT